MKEAPSGTENEFASRLATEMRTTLGHLKRKLRQHSEQHELTPSQIAVVLRLEKDGPTTVSSLARSERMRPQSMSAVIAPLQEMGFITGTADPNDGRKTLMSLTKVCRKKIDSGRTARQDWLAQEIQQKFSLQEQKKLSSAIQLLARLTQD
ncbi:MarR family winged helix-turn-helix transcriptional regulator [Terriglobus sp. RCC_193]|uniref:MarR family winged helix-turn-helix transcriptional regulator n=1 Tax=Terriglobus sp. RCC_193 TaxID=3239218 RepID=UPI0035260581